MADNNTLEILIKFLGDTAKAREMAKEIDSIKTATKSAGDVGMEAEKKVAEATEKTFTSKKQLKDIVKGLAYEFPLLGQAARLALNPLVLLTASIGASFKIMNDRMENATRAFGGFQMPDISEEQIARMDRFGESLGKFSEKLGELAGKGAQIRADLSAVQKIIQLEAGMQKAFGIETGGDKATQAQVLNTAANALEAAGRAKIAASGTVMGAASEAVELEKMKAMAAAAEKAQSEARARRNRILDFQAGNMSLAEKAKFGWDYAMTYGATTPGYSAVAQEDENIARQQDVIDRYARMSRNAAGRVGRRAAIAAGEKDIADAAGLRNQAAGMAGEDIIQRASGANARVTAATANMAAAQASGDFGALAIAARELAVASAALPGILADFHRAIQNLRQAGQQGGFKP